ncbi:MAG: 4Fe-4S dicluster domain-containing protein [Candidatus Omnitrophica bacterium]|nr:4Fe-4S dicluster domain-containing protein [Candidatus Omnitrophota bacterium]
MGTKKRIVIREEYCMGCRLCEVHCLVQHSQTRNIIKAFKGEFPKPLSRIIVEEKGYVSFALQCRHCTDAPCLQACITGTLYRDKKTKAVLCNEDKCVGCWMCIMVCPFGVISRDLKNKKIASKCDLCLPNEEIQSRSSSGSRRTSKKTATFGMGEELPVCVKNCPNGAIVFEPGEKDALRNHW